MIRLSLVLSIKLQSFGILKQEKRYQDSKDIMVRSIAVEFNILDKFVRLDPAIEPASFGILAQENLWTSSRRHRETYLILTLV